MVTLEASNLISFFFEQCMKSMFEWISCKAETKKNSTKYHGKLFDHSEQNMAGVIFTSVAYFLMIIIVIMTAVRRPPVEKDVLVVHVDLFPI